MIQIIAGEKGKGKTKVLIDKANNDIITAKGNIVYLDKSNKHMHELSNKIRLVNVRDYLINCKDEFLGFVTGIISQNHDIESIYFDSFLKITLNEDLDKEEKLQNLDHILSKFQKISEKFDVNFIISVSLDYKDIPENAKEYVIVSL